MISNELMKCCYYGCKEPRAGDSQWCLLHLQRHPALKDGWEALGHAVYGAMKTHINAHGTALVDSNIGSLHKRLMGAITAVLLEYPQVGNATISANSAATGTMSPAQKDSSSPLPRASVQTETRQDAVTIAELFHQHYEQQAPHFGYSTRPESQVPWERLPEANRSLIVRTVECVLHDLRMPWITSRKATSPSPSVIVVERER